MQLLTSPAARRLAAAIGASVIVGRGGHNALLEHPDEVGRAVRHAIDSWSPTGS